MQDDNTKGKRGRPRKTPVIKEKVDGDENIVIKKGRGRPKKLGSKEKVIIDKPLKGEIEDIIIPDDYIPPKIQRKSRVFNVEKKLFHKFADRYNGDIIVMSYVFDSLMRMYINKKIMPKIDEQYYRLYCNHHPALQPPLEPIREKDIHTSHAIMSGVSLYYKYPLIIDEEIWWKFEKTCTNYYSQFIVNEILKMLLDDANKINIDITKANIWCIL
jgi:hypothetical protein